MNGKQFRENTACSICGSQEKLEVHHKDLDHKNNDISNWIVLCFRCHRMVHALLRADLSERPDEMWCCFCGTFIGSDYEFYKHLFVCSMSDQPDTGVGRLARATYCHFCGNYTDGSGWCERCSSLVEWLMHYYKVDWDKCRNSLHHTYWHRKSILHVRTGNASCWAPEI